MLTCVEIQLLDFSRAIEKQVKQHDGKNSSKKSNIKACLNENFYFCEKPCTVYCFFPVNTE